MKVEWKSGFQHQGVSAEVVHTELETIRSKQGGVTDEVVVQVASDKSNPMHSLFEWDDSKAAHLHRLRQARQIFQCIVSVSPNKDRHRVYEVIERKTPASSKRTVYTVVNDVIEDPLAREKLIAHAIRGLVSWRERYKHLNELSVVMDAVDKAVEDLGTPV